MAPKLLAEECEQEGSSSAGWGGRAVTGLTQELIQLRESGCEEADCI